MIMMMIVMMVPVGEGGERERGWWWFVGQCNACVCSAVRVLLLLLTLRRGACAASCRSLPPCSSNAPAHL